MIASLAGLPKEYGVIRIVILARESTLTLKEFKAQLLGAQREIEGELNMVTQNLSALYVQGSSSSSTSSSNSHSHDHIPTITTGTITAVPYDSQPPLPQYDSRPPPLQFPGDSYGYGFFANSSGQNAPRSQSSNAQIGPYGNNYRGNNNYRGGNNYRNNNGFRGKGYSFGNSGGSRQLGNGNNNWSGNVDTKTIMVIECQICNKRGHTAINCFHKNTNVPITGFVVECQICGKKGHSALGCYPRGNYAYQGQEDKEDSVPQKE